MTTAFSHQPAPTDTDIEETLDRLFAYYPLSIDMGLERIYRLLHDLGNPHLDLPPVIHVAGTNGKGSTLAFLRAILEAAGKKVHVFTSPHLVRYNERVVLAGQEIDNRMLLDVLQECERVNNGQPITFFEITAVASFLAFSRVPADVILLETGMGGRLDATNVVPRPALTMITTISYDHAQFLGPTLPQIAKEKAGIFKKDAPAILGYQTDEALKSGVDIVFEHAAEEKGCDISIAEKDWSVTFRDNGFVFNGFGEQIEYPHPPNLPGPHQALNAGLAIAGLMRLKQSGEALWNIPEQAIITGIQKAHWPARLQRLSDHEKYLDIPKGTELWLDGGHNDSAGKALAAQAKIWGEQDKKPLHLVIAMLNTKNPEEFLSPLMPYVESLTVIPVPKDTASFAPDELAERAKPLCDTDITIDRADGWQEAIQSILTKRSQAQNDLRILTCGSLYLAGDILGLLPRQ